MANPFCCEASGRAARCPPPRQTKAAFDGVTQAGLLSKEFERDGQAVAAETISAAETDKAILVAEAKAYKTKITSAAEADAKYLKEVLRRIDEAVAERVPADAAVQRAQMRDLLIAETMDQLYQEMLRDVMAAADETFVLDAGTGADVTWRPIFSRDATLKAREKEPETTGYKPTPTPPPMPGPPGGPPR